MQPQPFAQQPGIDVPVPGSPPPIPGTDIPPVPAEEPPPGNDAPVEEPPPGDPDDPAKTPMIMDRPRFRA